MGRNENEPRVITIDLTGKEIQRRRQRGDERRMVKVRYRGRYVQVDIYVFVPFHE